MWPETPAAHPDVPPVASPAGACTGGLSPPLSGSSPGAPLKDFLAVTKALSDENRVRMLLLLREQEVCLCQLAEFIGLALSTASKHMSVLRQAGLVDARKQGRWLYFRQAGCQAPPVVRDALGWVRKSLADSPQAREDLRKLKEALGATSGDPCAEGNATTPSCQRTRGGEAA